MVLAWQKKRQRVARAEIFVGVRHAHTMQCRLQFVVAPAHQHVADIASDDAGQRLDIGPSEFFRFLARTKLQPTLSDALMQKCQAIEIGVCTGAPAGEVFGLAFSIGK